MGCLFSIDITRLCDFKFYLLLSRRQRLSGTVIIEPSLKGIENHMNKEEKIQEIFDYYRQQPDCSSQEMIVALLRELQEVYGYISPGLKEQVLEITGVKETFLQCLLRMYPSIREFQDIHEIVVCSGGCCGKKGSGEILSYLRQELKADEHGVSSDRRFQIRTRNCLKQCRTSPNLIVDGKLYPGVTIENIKKILNEW